MKTILKVTYSGNARNAEYYPLYSSFLTIVTEDSTCKTGRMWIRS